VQARLFLLGAICSEVTATLCLRGALDHPWLYAIVAAGYVGSFLLLSGALRAGMPLGQAYGIWGATGVVVTALLAIPLFGEHITPVMGLGLLLVVAGVLVVDVGGARAEREAST